MVWCIIGDHGSTLEIFRWHNPSDRTVTLRSTQPVTEMSTRRISWGKCGWQPYHLPVPLSWNLGTLTSWNPLGHSSPVTGQHYLFDALSWVFYNFSKHLTNMLLEDFNEKLSRHYVLKLVAGIQSHSEYGKIWHIKIGIFKSKVFLHRHLHKPDFAPPGIDRKTICVPTSWQVGKSLNCSYCTILQNCTVIIVTGWWLQIVWHKYG
jgi:hypothetical protein